MYLQRKDDEYAQKEELLSMLMKCDDSLYESFIEVLEESNKQIAGLMKSHFASQDTPKW
jgi:hypothetical protein